MWLRAPMTGMRENRNPDVFRKENENSTSEEQSRDRRYTKNVFTPVQRSRPVSAFTRRHLLSMLTGYYWP